MQNGQQHKKSRLAFTFVWGITLAFCLFVFIFASIKIAGILLGYQAASDEYTNLAGTFHATAPQKGTEDTNSPLLNNSQIDFAQLASINPDVAGWLYCPDTHINYPVVQGSDNVFYLTHTFNKTRNNAGCLFVDAGNTPDFQDRNTIIYGHNMNDHSMFSDLGMYKDQAFFEAHPSLELYTPSTHYTLHLFAGYKAGLEDAAWTTSFTSDKDFLRWAQNAKDKSFFTAEVPIQKDDCLVTLSTCVNTEEDKRFVVVGRLEKMP